MKQILTLYGQLLTSVDVWFARCLSMYPAEITCKTGCSACCRSLFDITLLDACYLKLGFERLDEDVRGKVKEKAKQRLRVIKKQWPDFDSPFILNCRPEESWGEIMANDDETPCVLLDDGGHCLAYDHRPMTCRLHGIPLIDINGEIFDDATCTLNFAEKDPFALSGMSFEFEQLFRDELTYFQLFTTHLLKQRVSELDVLIPTALLFDFGSFDWQAWLKTPDAGQSLRKGHSSVS